MSGDREDMNAAIRRRAGRVPAEEPPETSPVVTGRDIDAGVRGGERRADGTSYMNELLRKAARRPLDFER